jgi:hypothetical protein
MPHDRAWQDAISLLLQAAPDLTPRLDGRYQRAHQGNVSAEYRRNTSFNPCVISSVVSKTLEPRRLLREISLVLSICQ